MLVHTFHLPSSGAAAATPAYSAWNDTAQAGPRLRMVTDPSGTPMALSTVIENTGAAGYKRLWRQLVSDGISAQTISGLFVGQVRVSQSSPLVAHDRLTLCLKVVSNDGFTLRGTLLTLGVYGSTNLYSSEPTRTNRIVAIAAVMIPVDAQQDDRIVLEMGTQSSTNPLEIDGTVGIVLGDDGLADLPVDESTTANDNAWVSFVNGILFDDPDPDPDPDPGPTLTPGFTRCDPPVTVYDLCPAPTTPFVAQDPPSTTFTPNPAPSTAFTRTPAPATDYERI